MSKYLEYSERRKQDQSKGLCPEWVTTAGYQMLYDKNYLDEGESLNERFECIAGVLGCYTEPHGVHEQEIALFLKRGWYSASTPMLTAIGKPHKGMPVSCTGNTVLDSVDGFFSAAKEVALLTKAGFGTSSDLSGIRPRGATVSSGIKAAGIMPVVDLMLKTTSMVSQGRTRSGAWAGYIPFEHGDFYEYCQYILNNPKEVNAGFILTDKFDQLIRTNDKDALARIKMWLKVRSDTGTGYLVKTDAYNRRQGTDVDDPVRVRASNLCTEIFLPASEDLSFVCVLSSLNVAKYDEWSEYPRFIEKAFIILNAVNDLFIDLATAAGWDNHPELCKTLKAAKLRAVGLGVLGYHTYLQMHNIPFDQQGAFNNKLFSEIATATKIATRNLSPLGKVHNYRRIAIAPTLSTSLICGGVSGGIEPAFSNVYRQETAGGIVERINPVLLSLLKSKGLYTQDFIDDLQAAGGSIQGFNCFDKHTKDVFKTGFEIDQMSIIYHAAQRQQYIDQGQSLNLFNCNVPEYTANVHKYALLNKDIFSLYYYLPNDRIVKEPACSMCVN